MKYLGYTYQQWLDIIKGKTEYTLPDESVIIDCQVHKPVKFLHPIKMNDNSEVSPTKSMKHSIGISLKDGGKGELVKILVHGEITLMQVKLNE